MNFSTRPPHPGVPSSRRARMRAKTAQARKYRPGQHKRYTEGATCYEGREYQRHLLSPNNGLVVKSNFGQNTDGDLDEEFHDICRPVTDLYLRH